jgi:RimJ/RimL family protein N-acetyltransferase
VAGRDGGIFRDLPELETERRLLRKMRFDDAEAMFVYASDPEVTRYVLFETLRSRNTWGLRAPSPPAQRSSSVPSLWTVTESRRSS